MQGVLRKRKRATKLKSSYSRFWVVLEPTCLNLHRSRDKSSSDRSAFVLNKTKTYNITEAKVLEGTQLDCKFGLKLLKGKDILFKANTQEERLAWTKALFQALGANSVCEHGVPQTPSLTRRRSHTQTMQIGDRSQRRGRRPTLSPLSMTYPSQSNSPIQTSSSPLNDGHSPLDTSDLSNGFVEHRSVSVRRDTRRHSLLDRAASLPQMYADVDAHHDLEEEGDVDVDTYDDLDDDGGDVRDENDDGGVDSRGFNYANNTLGNNDHPVIITEAESDTHLDGHTNSSLDGDGNDTDDDDVDDNNNDTEDNNVVENNVDDDDVDDNNDDDDNNDADGDIEDDNNDDDDNDDDDYDDDDNNDDDNNDDDNNDDDDIDADNNDDGNNDDDDNDAGVFDNADVDDNNDGDVDSNGFVPHNVQHDSTTSCGDLQPNEENLQSNSTHNDADDNDIDNDTDDNDSDTNNDNNTNGNNSLGNQAYTMEHDDFDVNDVDSLTMISEEAVISKISGTDVDSDMEEH